jgi:uncharacterized protein
MTALLLPGVDLAAFAVALVARVRAAGVAVPASGPPGFVQALRHLAPRSRTELYWAARLTLVNRVEDLAAFDAVFKAVFGDAAVGLEPPARRLHRGDAAVPAPGLRTGEGPTLDAGGLPWAARPSVVAANELADKAVAIPDVLPSRIVARADEPFEQFEARDLRLLGAWLEQATERWPQRRSMRSEASRHGKRIDLRETMRASRSTGWEQLLLARTRRRRRPRRVVLICDVSRSMRPYATIYLHLMRATALRRSGIHPEVFAFSTSLTRLTAALSHRAPEVALARANAKVTDRYGGTHLGRSVAGLLSPPHGSALRGAVVIIASDGWDTDPPEVLEHALARVRRRAELVVWLNPRAAHPQFRPLAASMAAAMPYCDVFLPAHSLNALRELFTILTDYPALRPETRVVAGPATKGPR